MNSTAPDRTEPGVAALERGLTLMSAFENADGTLSLAELADATGYYKSTILRLAASLLRMGFLQRLDDGRYQLGPAVFRLGRRYQQSFRLGDQVVPVLRRLSERSGETASFYVRDGDRDICLFRVESTRPIRDVGVAEGDSFPIDGSAGSRTLSAHSKGRRQPAQGRDLVVVTRRSTRVPGAAAVICPVFGVDQKLVGTLLVSGPESRFTDSAITALRRLVLEQAAALTGRLGGDTTVFASGGGSASPAR